MTETEKTKLIQKIIFKFPKQYSEDLFNECYIQLDAILKRFNNDIASINTYSYKRLYYTCIDFLEANQLNQPSLDELVIDEEGNEERKIDLIKSELDLDSQLETDDYISKHNQNLSEVEKFIQNKYYNEGVSVATIIKVYQPYHLIKSEKTIYKILKK